ncbi:hypothetical protein TNCV_137281 [Trichonephila clavipes]|nr:hypothetical protein TNCV_137281 [Trichonephila clavipes]
MKDGEAERRLSSILQAVTTSLKTESLQTDKGLSLLKERVRDIPQMTQKMGQHSPPLPCPSDNVASLLIESPNTSNFYADTPETLDHLEDNIRRVIADIRPQMLEKVIENWTSRLDYIRASRGSYMPEIIFKIILEQGFKVSVISLVVTEALLDVNARYSAAIQAVATNDITAGKSVDRERKKRKLFPDKVLNQLHHHLNSTLKK